jgi:DNA-binding MarR family transcriptional regulator
VEKITRHKVESISNAVQSNLDDDYAISVSLIRKKIKVENYVMLFQEAVNRLLENKISKNGLRVFVYMLSKLQYSNHIGVDQRTIAEDNDISLVYLKKTLKELKDANIIIPYKDMQDKRRNVYIINPIIAWKGKVKNRTKFISDNQLKLDM